MTCRTTVLTFLAVALAFCSPSRADNDGSFCTSKGYIAYELRNGITPGVAGHVLKVVRFEPQRGTYVAGEVPLQDFQVHRMTCSHDAAVRCFKRGTGTLQFRLRATRAACAGITRSRPQIHSSA